MFRFRPDPDFSRLRKALPREGDLIGLCERMGKLFGTGGEEYRRI